MSKIVIFSSEFMPTFPFIEFPLYNYIKNSGCNIKYILREKDIRLTDPSLYKYYKKLHIETINKPKDILKKIEKDDLLITKFCYKRFDGDVVSLVRGKNIKIFQHDVGGIDVRVRSSVAQYLCVKSESLRRAVLKKFPKHYKNVFVTGTIQYDNAYSTKVDRDEFMRSYGLNPDKKLVILTPANPGEAWMDGLQDDYRKIVNIVRNKCPNYDLIVKGHPLDYTASMPAQPGIIHKNEHYKGKHSWEVWAPQLPVIKAEEGYKALKACDAVLNIRSSLAMETALFKKPLININRNKYTTNWPFDSKVMLDIEMDELAFVLNTNNYSVDEKACEEYVKRENYSGDGRAYVRTADLAIRILNK